MKLSRRQFMGLMGALGVSCAHGGNSAGVEKKILKGVYTFATIGDLHVLDAESTGIVNQAVEMMNADPEIEFVIMLGDMGTDGTLVEMNLAKMSLDRLEKPYFVIPGNHDVDLTLKDIYGNYRRAFDDVSWTDESDGWLFMGIDTCNGTASDVTVPAERMEAIQKQLKKVGKKRPIALFGHHPFNPHSKHFRVKNADRVLDLFSRHNLKMVASGHYHGNQVEERDGILFTTTACCSSTRGNFDGTTAKGYRLFRIGKKNALDTEFVTVRA